MSWLTGALSVYLKELLDALRDRRTLLTVLLSSVAMGPLMLMGLSAMISSLEERAEVREVMAVGIDHAPSLRNYLERQTYALRPAPANYEHQLERQSLADPVLVIPPDFEDQLARGESPLVELVSSSANTRANASLHRLNRLLQGYNQEQATLRLMVRGVSPAALKAIDVQERDLANPAARAAQFTGMLPFFILMAVLYGALSAALDTTAGERERGSLEPLLMNPTPRSALVVGKWGAVATVGMLIAVLSCLSFLPGQWLLRSESLAAMFQYGWREAAAFLALLLPLAAALSALLMAVAIRCKTFKEAQANSTVVLMAVSMLPLVSLMGQEGEQPWYLWSPVLAQYTLMGRVLKGEAMGAADLLLPAAICLLLTAACLVYVARALHKAAIR